MEFLTHSSEETYALGFELAKKMKLKGKKIGFIGELGAGKTLFIKGLLASMIPGITVTSPTYTLINVYESTDGDVVYHVDLYRINDPEELVMCGFYEITGDPQNTVLIEWYDRISKTATIDDDIITISIDPVSDNERRIAINE